MSGKRFYKLVDLTGLVFGRLRVVSRAINGNCRQTRWNCVCECGGKALVVSQNLQRGITKSCGCIRKEKIAQQGHRNATHGHATRNTPTYRVWCGMRMRCNCRSSGNYENYGAIGIRVCKRWDKFENFLADMGERPEGMSIDRINPYGDYEPSNCRWANQSTQSKNIRPKKRINQYSDEELIGELERRGYVRPLLKELRLVQPLAVLNRRT